MALFYKFSGLLLIIFCYTSCTTVSYTPQVSLDVSPQSINKTVSVEKFNDLTNPKNKRNPFAGISLTHKRSLSNELNIEVTDAIISDFQTNNLFEEVSIDIEYPDYYMKGEILEYKGISKTTTFFKTSVIALIPSIILYGTTEQGVFLIGTVPYLISMVAPVSRLNISDVELKVYFTTFRLS